MTKKGTGGARGTTNNDARSPWFNPKWLFPRFKSRKKENSGNVVERGDFLEFECAVPTSSLNIEKVIDCGDCYEIECAALTRPLSAATAKPSKPATTSGQPSSSSSFSPKRNIASEYRYEADDNTILDNWSDLSDYWYEKDDNSIIAPSPFKLWRR